MIKSTADATTNQVDLKLQTPSKVDLSSQKTDESSVGCVGSDSLYGGVYSNNFNNKDMDTGSDTSTPPQKGQNSTQPAQPTFIPSGASIEFILEGDGNDLLNPAVGLYRDSYYFGANVKTKVTLYKPFKGKKDVVMPVTEMVEQLCIITDEKKIISEMQLAENDIKFNGCLTSPPRWHLSHLDMFMKDFEFDEDPKKLFDEIKTLYKKYIDFINENEYSLMPLWDIGTYFFTLFDSYPYIHLHGLKNTAKSKVMTLSSNITFNAELSTNMTLATLFRYVHENRPTLYIDEYEIIHQEDKSKEDKDFETILNAGYKKGGTVPRMEQSAGKEWKVKRFEVYCPKMIANIAGLYGALASRCIKITMHRSKPDDARGDLWPSSTLSEWQELRNKLYVLALLRWRDVQAIYRSMKKEISISNRDWELWKPILTIAKFVDDGIYKDMKKFAEEKTVKSLEEEQFDESWDSKLIDTLQEVVKEERYYSIKHDIQPYLNTRFDVYQKPPRPEWIGRALRKLGLTDAKRDAHGVHYKLSQKIVDDLLARLQVKRMSLKKDPGLEFEELRMVDNTK